MVLTEVVPPDFYIQVREAVLVGVGQGIHIVFRVLNLDVRVLVFRDEDRFLTQLVGRSHVLLGGPAPAHVHIEVTRPLMLILLFVNRLIYKFIAVAQLLRVLL